MPHSQLEIHVLYMQILSLVHSSYHGSSIRRLLCMEEDAIWEQYIVILVQNLQAKWAGIC